VVFAYVPVLLPDGKVASNSTSCWLTLPISAPPTHPNISSVSTDSSPPASALGTGAAPANLTATADTSIATATSAATAHFGRLSRQGKAHRHQRCESMKAPVLWNPNDRAGHFWPTRRASDGQQEPGWPVEKTGLGADEAVQQRQHERGTRNANRIGGQVAWRNPREMVMDSAALITGIGGAMLVVTALLMAVIDNASACDVVGNGGLALVHVMEVRADERRDSDNLRNKIKPHYPRDHQAYGAR
jgi:hypothetical protein